jgi:hypothetical protein
MKLVAHLIPADRPVCPPDMRERAFRIIVDLIYGSPMLFNQVHSLVSFICKEEYDECIRDLSKYIEEENYYFQYYSLWPAEKTKHSDFLLDIQEKLYREVLLRADITILHAARHV